jgi:hypothetical protein
MQAAAQLQWVGSSAEPRQALLHAERAFAAFDDTGRYSAAAWWVFTSPSVPDELRQGGGGRWLALRSLLLIGHGEALR